MKEFVEKLIKRLEKEEEYQLKKADECEQKQAFEMISVSKSRRKNAQCFDVAIQVVKQLAEEYNQNIDQDLMIVESLPSLYPMMQPFEVEAIHRVVERTKDNNGWIPCSELPEENGMYLCTVFHADDYVVWIMRFNDGEFLKPDDVEDWNYELLAWMPIAPYQPKGE